VLVQAARTRRGRIGLTLLGFIVAVAAIGPFVAPDSPTAFISNLPYAPPSATSLLGTDTLGRDVLSRVLHGGWVLLLMAVAATILGVALGTLAGLTAAYLRGAADTVIMRLADVILAFPQLILALLLVSLVGPRLWLIVLAVAISHVPQVARVIYGTAAGVCERPFIKAQELNGERPYRTMIDEILPNLSTPIVVEFGLRLTFSIVVMAGLSFLGFGQPPPAPNWGYMISENRVGLAQNPWGVVVPTLLIALLTIGVNTFGDAVARVAMGATGRRSEIALAGAGVGVAGTPEDAVADRGRV
jgi:peptide/nickel transport system permease protein